MSALGVSGRTSVEHDGYFRAFELLYPSTPPTLPFFPTKHIPLPRLPRKLTHHIKPYIQSIPQPMSQPGQQSYLPFPLLSLFSLVYLQPRVNRLKRPLEIQMTSWVVKWSHGVGLLRSDEEVAVRYDSKEEAGEEEGKAEWRFRRNFVGSMFGEDGSGTKIDACQQGFKLKKLEGDDNGRHFRSHT